MKKILAATLLVPSVCFAAHPLITDDTGTQGEAGKQFEFSIDAARTRGDEVSSRTRLASTTLTYGWTDDIDVAVSVSHQRIGETGAATERGMGDIGLLMKWRFIDKDGFSLGLKPQIFLPTGNEKRGLGNGKPSYGANLLAGFETGSVTTFANAGYLYNDNAIGARKNLWNVSAAALWKIGSRLTAVIDLGSYRNPEPTESRNPVFALVGMIYSPTEKLDVDIGVRKGLNRAEVDYAVGTGLTVRW